MTPLAEPGICRTSTRPAIERRLPLRRRSQSDGRADSLGLRDSSRRKRERMRAQAKPGAAIILDDFAPARHRREGDARLDHFRSQAGPRGRRPRQRAAALRRAAPLIAQRASRRDRPRPLKAVGRRDVIERRDRHARTAPDIFDAVKGLRCARLRNAIIECADRPAARLLSAHAAHHAEAEAHRVIARLLLLRACNPIAKD